MKENILEVKDLEVDIANQNVLKNLSFEVGRGESVAIIGPNGSGKTTLFRALIGTIPFGGKINWSDGIKIGYVPQRIDLEKSLSLNLYDFLHLKVSLEKLKKSSIEEALSLVHLKSEKLTTPLSKLSGGELQRALIAFAMLGKPNILLFDEPTSGIDLPGEEQIYQTIHHLQDTKGFSLLFISHDLNLVYRYADRVVCLNKSVSCFGSPAQTLVPEVLDKLYGSKVMHHFHE